MKQLIFLFLGVAVFITAVGLYSKTPIPKTPVFPTLNKNEVTIGNTKISVEVATSEEERRKGLGGREALPENTGMLFIFPQKTSEVFFWMKDMKFAIDIIWITDDKIVKIDKNAQPEPGVIDEKLKLYYPPADINYVLEVNTGFSEKKGIKVGDKVQVPPTP